MIGKIFNKNKAFTVGEILVAMLIIAFISVLYITNLNNNKNKSLLYKAQYEKTYNDIITVSQTALLLDLKGTNSFGILSIDAIRDAFANRLDVSTTWDGTENKNNNNNLWANTVAGVLWQLKVDGNNNPIQYLHGMTLNNGVEIAFLSVSNAGGATTLSTNLGGIVSDGLVGVILLDLNSTSGPNIRNQDQYAIPLYFDGIRSNSDK